MDLFGSALGLVRRRGLVDWSGVATRYLPFADVATPELPLAQLVRLALFQVSVGMVGVLTVGTLNRVMIVEMGVGAWLVSLMVALPLLFAPFRALVGFKSDHHRSALGWRRVPFVWFGSGAMFAGLAIMPFALVLLTGETTVQQVAGHVATGLAFLLAGAGAQTVQTAGLALATDRATEATRPRVVALMYVMLLVGMVGSGLLFGVLLADYTPTRLVQVVQGTAVVCLALNAVAVWKQEARNRSRATAPPDTSRFSQRWAQFAQHGRVARFLLAVGLGTAAFGMQDIILEPYGGEVLGLSVGQTTSLTGIMAAGALLAFAWAARQLSRGTCPRRLAAHGLLFGLAAFSLVLFAEPLGSPLLFRAGVALIGFGGGLFSVGTLSAAMSLDSGGLHGMVLGAWGGVVATAAGLSVALGGALRDGVGHLAMSGALGEALMMPATGYAIVYHLELALLFATLAVLGPLVTRPRKRHPTRHDSGGTEPRRFGLADFPG
ncbi:MAG: BCD family MFS transporter [Ideonella sp. WA131b]|jgi:BCD family chlorophyll transporter-like MFS transporter|nr:BCD family MFS transporter [Ideonella sp. WA131b]